jgi:hypothetical protein
MLELDEKLTRYWLTFPLSPEKRIEMEERLKQIMEKRQGKSRQTKVDP